MPPYTAIISCPSCRVPARDALQAAIEDLIPTAYAMGLSHINKLRRRIQPHHVYLRSWHSRTNTCMLISTHPTHSDTWKPKYSAQLALSPVCNIKRRTCRTSWPPGSVGESLASKAVGRAGYHAGRFALCTTILALLLCNAVSKGRPCTRKQHVSMFVHKGACKYASAAAREQAPKYKSCRARRWPSFWQSPCHTPAGNARVLCCLDAACCPEHGPHTCMHNGAWGRRAPVLREEHLCGHTLWGVQSFWDSLCKMDRKLWRWWCATCAAELWAWAGQVRPWRKPCSMLQSLGRSTTCTGCASEASQSTLVDTHLLHCTCG